MQRVKRVFCHVLFQHVLLDRLHWLPVPQSVQFKLCLLTFKALHGLVPTYLADLCQPVASVGSVPPPAVPVTSSLAQRPPTSELGHSPIPPPGISSRRMYALSESVNSFKTVVKTFLFRLLADWGPDTRALVMTFSCYGALEIIVCAITITITIFWILFKIPPVVKIPGVKNKSFWIIFWEMFHVSKLPIDLYSVAFGAPFYILIYWSGTDPIYSVSQPPPLKFSDIVPKRLRIFSPNFTSLLYVHIYAGLQIFIQYLQLLWSYAILSATTIMCSKCPPSTATHAGWSHLICHNFVIVGDNWIKICSLA